MSTNPTTTASGQDPGPNPDSSQPDPLLTSGSFIDTNNVSSYSNGENLIRREPQKSAEKPQPQMSHSSSNGEKASAAESETSSTPGASRRQGATAWDTSWLPNGWSIEERVRSSGATAGTVDRYYIDPVSNRRFRSKKEVLYFLETGTVRKRKKGPEDADTDADSLEGSGGNRNKKSGSKATASASSFDFLNVPEKVTWTLTDASKGSWTPSVSGDEKVADSVKDEWAAAFASLTSRGNGLTKF